MTNENPSHKMTMQEKLNQLTAAGYRAQIDIAETGAARIRIWKGDLMHCHKVHQFRQPTLEAAIDQAFLELPTDRKGE